MKAHPSRASWSTEPAASRKTGEAGRSGRTGARATAGRPGGGGRGPSRLDVATAERACPTRLFRWCALVGLGLAGSALVAAVISPREGALRSRFGETNQSDVQAAAVYGALAAGLVVLLVWRLRRSLSWPGDRPAAAVQLATLLPAAVGVCWAVGGGLHELLAPGFPFNENLLTAGRWRIGGTLLGLLAGVGLSVLLLGAFGVARLVVRSDSRRRHIRRWSQISRTLVLLLPMGWFAFAVLVSATPARILACAASTGFVLTVVYAMQRHRRLPVRVLLGGFAWGVFIASGFGALVNAAYMAFAGGVLRAAEVSNTGFNLTPAVFEEAGKAAGIILLCLLARRWFDGLVSGLVIGASVGLGFNFIESIEYMSQGAAFQHWIRQTVTVMTSHMAFSAIVGAGIGVAYQHRSSRGRRVVGYAFVAAVCGHFVSNYWMGRLGEWLDVPDNPYLWVLVLNPVALLVVQVPFLVMYLFLLRRGLRDQAEAVVSGARAEVWEGHGAITSDEVVLLRSPGHRWRAGIQTLRRGGLGAWRRTSRLRAAQLDLVMCHNRGAPGEDDPTMPTVRLLRDRVLRMKVGISPTPAARAAATAGVS